MKKFILIALFMLVPNSTVAHDTVPTQKKTTRNKKAYAKFVVGAVITVAATGCCIGGLRIATRGSYDKYLTEGMESAAWSVIKGACLFGFSIPAGEIGLKLTKNGLIGLWKDEEEDPLQSKKEPKS